MPLAASRTYTVVPNVAGTWMLLPWPVRLPPVSDQNSRKRESFECFVNATFE